MIRRSAFLSLFLFLVAGSSSLFAQAGGAPGENQFDVSVTLFTTMAAINAAGYDAGLDSPATYPIRAQVRAEVAKHKIPSLDELRYFYSSHRRGTDSATLSQYISFALLAGPPPDFALPGDVPQDVEVMRGLSGLLARFYKEADLEDLWARSQQAYLGAIQQYQDPVINALLEANGYLRNPTSGEAGRRFQIYLSLLAAPNEVQMRSYQGNYFVVLTPSQEPLVDQIRSAYLSYLLDPLSLRYSKDLDTKIELQKYANRAPALETEYKDDFELLATKCLIKAIESRLMHGEDKRQAYVDEAMKEGFILTAAFAELLPAYEKQPQAMRLYYPDLVHAIDVSREKKRLKSVQFVESIPHKVIVPAPSEVERNRAEQTLEAAEALYEQHDYEGAKKLFKQSLPQTADVAMHGRSEYGLARIAVHENARAQAVELFRKVVEENPDPQITAWSHVFLGRLAMVAGDTAAATTHFKQALAIDGASVKAREAAQDDLQKLSGDTQQ